MEEQELDILKMTVEEGTKTFPQAKKRSRFFYNPYISLIFNPLNGFLIAMIALSIGGIIAIAAPLLLAEAASILLYISAAGLIFSTLSIIPFAIWGGLKRQEIEELEYQGELSQKDWEELQETLRLKREEVEAELERVREERPKELKRTQLLYDMVPYIPFIFNPANGILIAAIAFSIAAIIAAVTPELLAAAAPALLSIAAGGLIFSAITIIPFTIWEAIKHYHEWRLEMEIKQPLATEFDETLQEEIPKHDPYIGSYDHYLSKLLFVKSVKTNPKMHPRAVVSFADSQLGQWVKAHYWQAMIVGLGILFCALAIGACSGFFLGNPICFDLLHPIFALFQSIFSIGINGLHLPFLAIFTDPFVIEVITAVFITALPLIIADNVRRVMEAIGFYSSPPQADAQNTDPEEVIEKKDEEKQEFYVLHNQLKGNADVRAWNYLVSVFDKSGTMNKLSEQKYDDLNDYDLDSIEDGTPTGQPSQN